jgi:DNA-binding CsgD family transcriptional regulator
MVEEAEVSPARGMLDPVTARASSAVLVGRDGELAALRDALKRARSGEPAAVLVGGEAGVGKTRLVEEFQRAAATEGAQVLTGRCVELGEEGLPFAPFAAALRELMRRDGRSAFAGFEAEFARLLPELGPAGPEASADRGHLFDLVVGLFERLATERPLVLVIEDLHWADRSTRDLISFMVRSARGARALFVATYRSDELHRGHPLRPFLAELDRVRGIERLDLDRLDREGTAEILHHLVGGEPAALLVDSVFDRAQGNPFFIEELAACTDSKVGCTLPASLRDLLLSRVDRLAEPAQRILRIAAVGGTRLGHRLLARAAAVPDVELEEGLRAAVAAQLLVANPEGGYEFRHALVREAVHDDLLPGEHARLHARYAAAVEAEPDLVAAGRAAAEIAHHWHAAQDYPRALPAAVVAAEEAGARYAYAEKSQLLDRALQLWEVVPDAEALLGMDHLALLEKSLAAAIKAGDYARALGLARAALDEVDSSAEPLRAARLLERRAKLLRTFGKSDGATELRRAYELAGHVDDAAQRATLLADLADALIPVDREGGARIAQEAAAVAQDLGDAGAAVSAAITFGRVCSRLLSVEAGLVEMQRATERAQAAGDLAVRVRALVNMSDLLFEVGHYAESARWAEDGWPDAQRLGLDRTAGMFLLTNHAEALLALGRWDEAEARLAEAYRLDPPGTLGLPHLVLRSQLRLARGDARAGELVGRTVGFLSAAYLAPQSRLTVHELRLTATLAAGDVVGALAAARIALDGPGLDASVLAAEPRYAWPLLATVARAAAAGSDEELAARVRTVAGQVPARYPAEQAYAAEVAALLAGPDADPEQVCAAWQTAVLAWRLDGQPYPLSRVLLAYAESAAATAERGAAADALAEAGAIASQLGATPIVDAVATLGRRLGVRGAAGAAGASGEVLTGRELEVLRLVAEGLSNRRIAERLFISPKTASVHVSRIIAKLEASNRVEAAVLARRLGLLDSV